MKLLVFCLLFSFSALGIESNKPSQQGSEGPVQKMIKKKKSERRKKVQMCHDCGKPEPECTCEGEEHRKGL